MKYKIGTKIITKNIEESCTDIYGIPNGAIGTIIEYGNLERPFYRIEFDKIYEGSINTKTIYLTENEVSKYESN